MKWRSAERLWAFLAVLSSLHRAYPWGVPGSVRGGQVLSDQVCLHRFILTHPLFLFVSLVRVYSVQLGSDFGRIFHLLIVACICSWSSLKNAFFLNSPWFTLLHWDCLRCIIDVFGYSVRILCHHCTVRTFFYQCGYSSSQMHLFRVIVTSNLYLQRPFKCKHNLQSHCKKPS